MAKVRYKIIKIDKIKYYVWEDTLTGLHVRIYNGLRLDDNNGKAQKIIDRAREEGLIDF